MTNEWMIALGKAVSALRFQANNREDLSEPARQELLNIVATLTEIYNEC